MKRNDMDHLRRLELAVLLGLAFTLLWGAWSLQRQDALAEKMIRLHVVANSDAPADQELKLRVRDRVLAQAGEILKQTEDVAQARAELERALPTLGRTAAEAVAEQGYGYAVSVRLGRQEFPQKLYDGFALPAGEYTALRVTIGEGKGHNWWCVVFPPLCTAAVTDLEETAVAAGMDGADVALMREENTAYTLKFRSLELWESLRQRLGKDG